MPRTAGTPGAPCGSCGTPDGTWRPGWAALCAVCGAAGEADPGRAARHERLPGVRVRRGRAARAAGEGPGGGALPPGAGAVRGDPRRAPAVRRADLGRGERQADRARPVLSGAGAAGRRGHRLLGDVRRDRPAGAARSGALAGVRAGVRARLTGPAHPVAGARRRHKGGLRGHPQPTASGVAWAERRAVGAVLSPGTSPTRRRCHTGRRWSRARSGGCARRARASPPPAGAGSHRRRRRRWAGSRAGTRPGR